VPALFGCGFAATVVLCLQLNLGGQVSLTLTRAQYEMENI
jgi:hypothetical protein